MNTDSIWAQRSGSGHQVQRVGIRTACRVLRIVAAGAAFASVSLPAIGAEQDDAVYRALVQRVEGGDFTIDFRSLRMACVRSNLCEPRGTKAGLVAMNRAVNDREYDKAAEIGEQIIGSGFVNIEAHATSAGAYTELHDLRKAKFHLDVTAALLRSILNSGDGKTLQTAFEVICDREEYDTLSALGQPYLGPEVSSTVVEDAGHHYDRWEIRHPQTGQVLVFFFNTDAFSPTKSRVGTE
jgi:hypothetical protein